MNEGGNRGGPLNFFTAACCFDALWHLELFISRRSRSSAGTDQGCALGSLCDFCSLG